MSSSRSFLVRELNNKLTPLINNNKNNANRVIIKSENTKYNSTATAAACPHLADLQGGSATATAEQHHEQQHSEAWANARPYKEIPGPRALPILGNTWR